MNFTSVVRILLASYMLPDILAFQGGRAFTGRARSVSSHEELVKSFSYSSLRVNTRQQVANMPPFLQGLRVRMQEKPGGGIPSLLNRFRRNRTEDSVTVLDRPEVEQDQDEVDGGAPSEFTTTSLEATTEAVEKKKEESKTDKMMQQVKDAGLAGIISYALWEVGFWTVSVPVCIFGYREVTGHWPDLSSTEDLEKLGAEAFAFVNFARFAVPLRIGLALSTTPWIEENIVERFLKKKNNEGSNIESKTETNSS